ncbi:MAG: hypothetical protein E6J34_20640 [Chloroflexi bacterium]|nr:MAG: hypothetical protein E6J34_20640 [Chloroflexota bacterium]
MISQTQKIWLQALTRDLGYTVRVKGSQIEVRGRQGTYLFRNNEVGYHVAMAMLRGLKSKVMRTSE